MQATSYARTGYGVYNSWGPGGSESYRTGPYNIYTYDLKGVASESNPKPWSIRRNSFHTYEKRVVQNGDFLNTRVGQYLFQPEGYRDSHPYETGQTQFTIMGEYNTSSVRERALEKLLEAVRGEHANLAVDLAEARKTLQMVKKALRLKKMVAEFATEVVKHRKYKKIRKGPTQGQRRLDYVNGKWLEYRYGWLPLLSSIHSVAEVIMRDSRKHLLYKKARSGQKIETMTVSGSGVPNDPYMTVEIDGSYRVEFGMLFDLSDSTHWSEWTSLNPLSIAWELVPFSFVADWFLGIGQALENWENYYLFADKFVTGYESSSYREDRYYLLNGFKSYPVNYWPDGKPIDGTTFESNYGFTQMRGVKFKRLPLYSLPSPSLFPRVKSGLFNKDGSQNTKRMLDTAALISQVVKPFR
jgi:hypothetical protein